VREARKINPKPAQRQKILSPSGGKAAQNRILRLEAISEFSIISHNLTNRNQTCISRIERESKRSVQ